MSSAAVAIAQWDELVGTWGLKIDVIRKIPGKIYGEMERGNSDIWGQQFHHERGYVNDNAINGSK